MLETLVPRVERGSGCREGGPPCAACERRAECVLPTGPDRKNLLGRRQQCVLVLTALGLNCKEVAHELGVSEHTIKNHLWAIRRKLGAASTTQAAIAWLC